MNKDASNITPIVWLLFCSYYYEKKKYQICINKYSNLILKPHFRMPIIDL